MKNGGKRMSGLIRAGNTHLETMMTRTMTSPRRKLAMLAVTTELKKTKSIEGMHRRIVDFL